MSPPEPEKTTPALILPIGTQVVARVATGERPAGAVGVVLAVPVDPLHSYRVRFNDGGEAALKRDQLSIRKQHQRDGLLAEEADEALFDRVIYRCVVGSRAYGLHGGGSDTDRRGIYLPPAERHWSLFGVPEQLEKKASPEGSEPRAASPEGSEPRAASPEASEPRAASPEASEPSKPDDECYWELRKFLLLALKANPNVLECLYTPLVEHATPLAERLLAMREAFLSRLVYQTYNGYVMSQFRRLEQDLRTRGAIKWKHAMHLIRLLLSGIRVLDEGLVPLDVGEHRERLLAIRRGETPWEEVDAWRLALHRDFDRAFEGTGLPERPDYERANAFLIDARRAALAETLP